jgi:hypothetical protein
MPRTTVSTTINAPLDLVFRTVADINEYSKVQPHIVKVEFLSDIKLGVGARFRETRLMKGKEVTTELEVIEYVEDDRCRIVSDTHGTIWDSVMTVKQIDGLTLLTLTMDANTKSIINKIINFMISGMIKKAIEKDLDGVKIYCEKSTIY